MIKQAFISCLFLISLGGCSFTMQPLKLDNPPTDCQKICSDWNLELVSVVAVGKQDYPSASTACVCDVKKTEKSVSSNQSSKSASVGATLALEIMEEDNQVIQMNSSSHNGRVVIRNPRSYGVR